MKGRALLLCPVISDIDLLCYREGIVHINAEIPDSALYLGVTKQKLDGAQIPGAAVDQRRLRSPQSVCAVQMRVWPYADKPIGHKSSILARCHASPRLWSRKKELARLLVRLVVDGLARMLGQLKSNWSPGLSLTHRCSIDGVTIGSNIIDPDGDYVAAPQFTVDGKIEHRQVTSTQLNLQHGANRPDMLLPERRLCSN